MKRLAGLAAGLALLALAACNEKEAVPLAQEPAPTVVAEFCGMSLYEHPGPKAQVFVRGQAAPLWFSSVRDMFAFTMVSGQPLAIRALYVNDMGRVRDWNRPEPGTWIAAHDAFYVIGGDRRGGMNQDEAIPYGTEAAARQSIAAHGGRMVRFAAMPAAYILPETETGRTAPGSGNHD